MNPAAISPATDAGSRGTRGAQFLGVLDKLEGQQKAKVARGLDSQESSENPRGKGSQS